MTVLAPRLCPLDEQILAALDGRGRRSDRVADLVLGGPAFRCCDCGAVSRASLMGVIIGLRRRAAWEQRPLSRCPEWDGGCGGERAARLIATPEQRREVREILRGLEATGYATCRGGWWRRA